VLAEERGDKSVVLKLGFDRTVLQREATALRVFDGEGWVRLFAQDNARGALLIEQVVPGVALSTYFQARDQESVVIICELMQKLHRSASVDLTSLLKKLLVDKSVGGSVLCYNDRRK